MNLKQLSENLGLSQTTVSRALNGYPEVNEATRKRVQLAAAEGNYRPNLRAMSLATGRAMAIGHVIPVANRNDVVNPIFAEFVAGASQTYNLYGYELMLTIAETKDEESIYRSLAAKRAVDGVVVHSPLRDDPRLALLTEINLPFVFHGRVCDSDREYNWIDMNNRRAFKQATQLLIDLGHKDIALVNGQEQLSFAWLRKLGYVEALEDNQIEPQEYLQSSHELTETYGHEVATKLLASDRPPSAFLVSSYITALGVRRAISQANLTMGKDVSVIIHDDELSYFDNGGTVPQFTSTRSSVRASNLTMGSSTGPYRKH